MPSNQKRIRDLERLIKKHGESADLLQKLEQAKNAKEEVVINEKTRKNATKYHMVKFLERKKLTRMIRSVETNIKKKEGNSADLELKRKKLMEDLAYVM
jgi:hypothetical protein